MKKLFPVPMHSVLVILCVVLIDNVTSKSTTGVYAEKIGSPSSYEQVACNFTSFHLGCEDEFGSECVDKPDGGQFCRCKPDHNIVIRGRFCLKKWPCTPGNYWDEFEKKCKQQRKADPLDLEQNYCRYDYQCLGEHVRCRMFGYNRNCVCEPGFRYSSNGTCEPMSGIGGHCRRDEDCDASGFRRMFCEQAKNAQTDGTCQCQAEHTYNYDIDGCESDEWIAERKRNMRSLIILFIIFGIIFGFALTFNFGWIGTSPRQHSMLMKRLEAESERFQKRLRPQPTEQIERIEEGLEQLDDVDHIKQNQDNHSSPNESSSKEFEIHDAPTAPSLKTQDNEESGEALDSKNLITLE